MADFILQDILVEILKRLPVQCLLRFKCVQKSWYHLIRSPYFIHHYNNQENKNKYLLFQGRYHSDFFFRVDDEQCNEYCPGLRFPIPRDMQRGVKNKIHGSCRGLICFSVQKRTSSRLHQIYLWNPAIRKFKILPNSPDSTCLDQYSHSLALGYFSKISDYKVINFQSYFFVGVVRRVPTVHIYSLSTNSWKTVGNTAQFSNYGELYNSVIVNGVVYWIGIRHSFMQVIVCFDIENEKIREIMLPPKYALDRTKGRISSLNLVQHSDEVLLSAVCFDSANTSCILDIFAVENDGVNVVGTKKVTIDLNEVGRNLWPLGFRHNGEIVLFNYHHNERGFLSYDHEKDVATEILDDSWDLWSYADIRVPDNRRYHYNTERFNPFDAGEEQYMQFMYVSSFEESLVFFGDGL